MAHAQKPGFVFLRNGQVHLNRQGRQISRLLAAEVCASAVVMLATPRSEVVCRVLATHSIHQFPLHFPSRASPCAITFQVDSGRETGPSHRPLPDNTQPSQETNINPVGGIRTRNPSRRVAEDPRLRTQCYYT